MAETTALGPVHTDCPTCACGKRAPVVPGGSVAWTEHEAAWVGWSRRFGPEQSPEDIAARGGFSMGELTEYLGGVPKTWRATPAERVTIDYVEVFEDETGEFRWHRKAANHEIIADSGEGYGDVNYAIKMAARVNPGIEVRIPPKAAAPKPPQQERPVPPDPIGPATPEQPIGPDAPVPAPEEPPAVPPVEPEAPPTEPPVEPAPAPTEPEAPDAGDTTIDPPPPGGEREFDGPVIPTATPPPSEATENGAAGASPLEPPPG